MKVYLTGDEQMMLSALIYCGMSQKTVINRGVDVTVKGFFTLNGATELRVKIGNEPLITFLVEMDELVAPGSRFIISPKEEPDYTDDPALRDKMPMCSMALLHYRDMLRRLRILS